MPGVPEHQEPSMEQSEQDPPNPKTARLPRLKAGPAGAAILLLIALPCFLLLPWSCSSQGDSTSPRYDDQRLGISAVHDENAQFKPPGKVNFLRQQRQGEAIIETEASAFEPLGTDRLGRSMLVRCLMGGAISLGVGISAALVAVFIGVTWGALAGYIGGRTDAFMMRVVDIFYGLPYLLLVIMISVMISGLTDRLDAHISEQQAQAVEQGTDYEPTFMLRVIQNNPLLINLVTLVIAIGGVSWLTMARVIRGQVLSLRTMPYIEAARAQGMGPARIIRVHLLPNLIGPIIVYSTLAVPQAILQESFLSFLGIGVQEPLPSWGQLASEGVKELPALALPELPVNWWVLLFPCLLLGLTLLSLNFLGDALRERFDPRSAKR
ncbi:MAG: ABC transporter permease [Planctomycetota bacterium]